MTPANDNLSPLEELVVERLGGRTFIRERVVSVGTTRTVLAPNNPNRLAWDAINESLDDVRVSTDPTLTTTSGWLLPANGGVISMIYYDDGEGVGYEVYSISTVAARNIRIREVIRL